MISIRCQCKLIVWLILMIITIQDRVYSLNTIYESASNQLYVVPFPLLLDNYRNDGSLTHPYSSLQQAMDHIKRHYSRNRTSEERTTINLYPTHHFVDTIRFDQVHSHTRLTTMNSSDSDRYANFTIQDHTHRRLPVASISGGILVTGWNAMGPNTYSAVVPQPIFVNQLFVNNRRIIRSRIPMNQSDYLQYAAPLNDSTKARYGFQYVFGQFDFEPLDDAMVIVYHSWTTSHHYIDRLIEENNTVLFTNPSDQPIGSKEFVVQSQRRFHIENVCAALVPNSFCYINETKTVYLMTDGSYDPAKEQIIASAKEIVVTLTSDDVNRPVEDIIIDNVAIQHGAWNIDRYEQADSGGAGFLNSAAIFIANATSVLISNVEISHTGSYGLWIREGTSNINFMNSLVTDTGAGGVRSGSWRSDRGPSTSIKIISNEISYGGNEFPGGIGIVVVPSSHVIVADNIIHHQRYDGISVCSESGYGQALTNHVLIQGNYIYDIGRHILNDQGGIYTIGLQPTTLIDGNVIKNVFSYAVLMFGIYLDEGSSQIIVSNNIVYNTGWAALFQHYGANNTIINNVFARASLISLPQPGDWLPDGDLEIQLGENHTSWTFTRNIIYDTFQRANHSAYKSALNTTALFNNNLYYNPYGFQLLFGPQQTSFEEWQKTGQDNGSVVADPLFIGDVNQCDFFTISSNSPAAKLGFANLTKLSKWTPGCDMNEMTNDNQFYHW